MTKDVGERTNEYKEHPEIVGRLTKLLEKYVADGRSTPGTPQKNDTAIKLWKEGQPDDETLQTRGLNEETHRHRTCPVRRAPADTLTRNFP